MKHARVKLAISLGSCPSNSLDIGLALKCLWNVFMHLAANGVLHFVRAKPEPFNLGQSSTSSDVGLLTRPFFFFFLPHLYFHVPSQADETG